MLLLSSLLTSLLLYLVLLAVLLGDVFGNGVVGIAFSSCSKVVFSLVNRDVLEDCEILLDPVGCVLLFVENSFVEELELESVYELLVTRFLFLIFCWLFVLVLSLSLRLLSIEFFATVDISTSYSLSSSLSLDTRGMTNRTSVSFLTRAVELTRCPRPRPLVPDFLSSPLKVSLPPLNEKLFAIGGFRTKSEAMSIKVLFSCNVISCRLVKVDTLTRGLDPARDFFFSLESLKFPSRKS